MSKLIVEMPAPKACPCELAIEIEGNFYPCFAYYGVVERAIEFDYCVANVTRPDWCPICGVLPDEHGDLIDRNYLLKFFDGINNCIDKEDVLSANAVIAAERTDDEGI